MTENLNIDLMAAPDGGHYFRIRVRSGVKPQVQAQGTMVWQGTAQRTASHVAIVAGACAEWLNENHQDNLTAEDFARRAEVMTIDLIRQAEAAAA